MISGQLIVSAVNLRDAVTKSHEYSHQLESTRVFSMGNSFIESQAEILEKSAKYGVTELSILQQEFYGIAEKLFRKTLDQKPNKSLLDVVALKFSSIVHVRKVTAADDSQKSEDIIARANAAVTSGKLELAILEIAKLSAADQKLLTNWIIKAKDYVNSVDAAEAIFKYVILANTKQD